MKRVLVLIAISLLTIKANAQWKLENTYSGICYDDMKWSSLKINKYGDSQIMLKLIPVEEEQLQERLNNREHFAGSISFEMDTGRAIFKIDTFQIIYTKTGTNDTKTGRPIKKLALVLTYDLIETGMYELFCKSTQINIEVSPIYPEGDTLPNGPASSNLPPIGDPRAGNLLRYYGTMYLYSFNMTGSTAISKHILAVAKMKMAEKASKPKEVTIGSQVWMTRNLDVITFRNGDKIPEAKTNEEWRAATENKQPAWCYYDNDPANGDEYGKLYNWYAVNDGRGLAPTGWHVPAETEWDALEVFLNKNLADKLKSTSGWENFKKDIICSNCNSWNNEYRKNTPCPICRDSRITGKEIISGNGNDISGFNGLPTGYRTAKGSFFKMGFEGYWHCSTEYEKIIIQRLNNYPCTLERFNVKKGSGASVRCIKDK